jgi:hypothetical protein
MRVYVGLLMLAAFFIIPANHNLSIIVLGLLLVLHLEWLALYWSFSSGRSRKICTILQQMGSKGPIPEKMSQTLLWSA